MISVEDGGAADETEKFGFVEGTAEGHCSEGAEDVGGFESLICGVEISSELS